ncbi:MAG: hypothetical protein ACAI44_20290 [Candidatus Sericytochromatia bacterium]
MRYRLTLLPALTWLLACAPAPLPTAAYLMPGQSGVRVLDLGRSTGAIFEIRFQLAPAGDFRLKDSSSGAAASKAADIDHFVVYLLETDAAPSAEVKERVVAGPMIVPGGVTGPEQGFIFRNVAANQPGLKYFVGLQARDAGDVNLTAETGVLLNAEPLAVSNTGGDGSGAVSVGADLSIGQAQPLMVILPLLDARGAALDTRVSVTDGETAIPPVSISSS